MTKQTQTNTQINAQATEMLSLNLDDLNVEELERRLELASLAASLPGCPGNSGGCTGRFKAI